MATAEQILFVYNVDLTVSALVSDFLHRLTSPETYPCRLCDLTYDRFTMKRDWKRFTAGLGVPVRFELRDRFHRQFPAHAAVALPAVFHVLSDGSLHKILSAERIGKATTLDELESLVQTTLAKLRKEKIAAVKKTARGG